jgi:hypothetical protein
MLILKLIDKLFLWLNNLAIKYSNSNKVYRYPRKILDFESIDETRLWCCPKNGMNFPYTIVKRLFDFRMF